MDSQPGRTPPELRRVRDDELDPVLALNQASRPALSSMDRAEVARFAAGAPYFQVALVDGELAGFLIALLPGADYDSVNYRWFSERLARFTYIDRVAVAPAFRRRGVGRALYDDIERFAREHDPTLACEVNIQPRNEGSLRFHRELGYLPVGRQHTDYGVKEVVMLVKELEGDAALEPLTWGEIGLP